MTRLAPAARASTTLPLPSSPQWPPTIAVTGIPCSFLSLRAATRRSNLLGRRRLLRPFGPRNDSWLVRSLGSFLNLARHLRLELPQPLSQLGIMGGQHLHGQNGGVAGAPWTDGDRRHRHPRGHLYRGEIGRASCRERVFAVV